MSEQKEKQGFQYLASHGELFGLYMKNMLLSVFTLGIWSFWGRVEINQYIYRSLLLRDRPFGYHATGKEMFIGFLKGMVLVLGVLAFFSILSRFLDPTILGFVTFALYIAVLFFVTPWLLVGKWRFWLSRTSWSHVRFRFAATSSDMRPHWIRWILLQIVTLGLYTPAYVNHLQKFFTDHIRFGHLNFSYHGQTKDLYKIYIKGILLTIVTLGLYYPWFMVELSRYMISRTQVDGNALESSMTGNAMFGLLFTNLLLVVFTFGLAIPVAMNRQLRYFFTCLSIHMDADALDHAISEIDSQANANAAGLEQAADVADILSGVL